MTARTTVASATGATFAISAALPATYDAAGYTAAGMTYTEIAEVTDFPTYGAMRTVNKHIPITGAIVKVTGPVDYGDGDLNFAHIPGDAGQLLLKAAEASNGDHYSLKISHNDGEVVYLDVIVSSYQYGQLKAGEVRAVKAVLGICRAPVIVAAA